MLSEIIYPHQLSAAGLDRLLAQGWFRHGQLLYKAEIVCINDLVCDTLSIRLSLNKHAFTKSQQKLLRKNDNKFRVEIGKASITEEKENLFQKNKYRFTGFLTESLEEFLTHGHDYSIFNTYEITVFDNETLVAFSYFDLGKNSMAALLGVINWNYKKASLGKYTMLKELEIARQNKLKFYYPGPITVQSSTFDYKLNLGNFTYLANTNRWRKLIDKQTDRFFSTLINEKTNELEQAFEQQKIDFKTYIYPSYFSGPCFLNTCKFILIKSISKKHFEIAYYDLETEQFTVALVKRVNPKSLGFYKLSKENYTIKSIYTSLIEIIECKKMAAVAFDLFK